MNEPGVPAPSSSAGELLRQLESLWEQGQRPDPDTLLHAAGISSPHEVAAVLAADQWQRWQAGQRVPAEDYFARHPAVAADPAAALVLVYGEFFLREQRGETPTPEQYLARFPRCAEGLRRQLDFHAALREPARLGPGECSDTGPHYPAEGAALPPPAPAASASGLDLRGYELFETLGEGGMGEVYRSRDPGLRRDLALKVLGTRWRGNEEMERRFESEARITGSLQHPAIVPVHNLGRLPDGRLYFTMKVVRGQTFAQMLAEPGRAAERVAAHLGVFEQVCQAVAYAHSKGVIHRDLKPLNIMVGRFGEVQVMDWGLAKVIGAPGGETLPESSAGVSEMAGLRAAGRQAQTQGALGTPSYMAPEQANGEWQRADERLDVFGLGGILCAILTGAPPYRGDKSEEVRRKAQRADLGEAFARLDGCGADGALVALAKECLCPEVDGRPRDAGVVAARVAEYLASVQERLRAAEVGRAAAQARAEEATAKAKAERRARRFLMGLAASVLLLVVAGGSAAWVWREQRARKAWSEDETREVLAGARALMEEGWAGRDATLQAHDLAKLEKALAEADRAADIARSGAAGAQVRQETAEFQKEAEERLKRAKANRDLLDALLDVSAPQETRAYKATGSGMMMALAQPTVDEQYAAAFRRWGLDVDGTAEAEVVARLQQEPEVVLEDLTAALDGWMEKRRQKGLAGRGRLLRMAERLDRSAAGRRLRVLLEGKPQPNATSVAGLVGVGAPWPALWEVAHGATWRHLQEVRRRMNPAREPVLTVRLLSRACFKVGDVGGAETVLRRALAVRPHEVVLLNALGLLLEGQRPARLEEAIGYYRAARARRPRLGLRLGQALVRLGLAANGRRQNGEEGEALLRKMVQRQPRNPEMHFHLGFALERMGDGEGAIACYRKAIAADPTYAPAHTNLGHVLSGKGDVEGAIACCRKAIAADPKYAVAHHNLGAALYGKGKVEEAIVCWRKAIAANPRYAPASSNLGKALYDKGEVEEAIACYQKAIAADPKLAPAHNNLGIALAGKGQWDVAIACYQKAIALDPKLLQVHNNLGLALEGKGEVEEAIACYRRAIAADPKHAPAHTNLGAALYGKGKVEEAIECYRKAIAADPMLAPAHYSLGAALERKGKAEAAIACYREAIAADPKYAQAYYNLGIALHGKGQRAEAIACWRKAIAADPKHAPAHYCLGVALERKGKAEEAIAYSRKAIAADPKYAQAHYNLGVALAGEGKVVEAIECYREAIAADRKHAPAHNNLGLALAGQGQVEQAIACFRKAIAADPKFAPAHDNLGVALRGKGQVEQAMACHKRAIAADPNYANAHYNLGIALAGKGQVEEAIECFKKAIALDPRNALAQGALGQAWIQQGHFAQARASVRRCLNLLPPGHPVRRFALSLLKQCEQLLALDKRLTAVLEGKAKPNDAAERLNLAVLAQQPYKRQYAFAARLYAAAFADKEARADLLVAHRYNAARAAALAAAGKGEGAARADAKEQARWRGQALDWLRLDLARTTRALDEADARTRVAVRQWMRHWQTDPDLAGVRAREALAKLPAEEQKAWRKLWADVEALRQKAQDKTK
jgi:serine/threonine-protein kinase